MKTMFRVIHTLGLLLLLITVYKTMKSSTSDFHESQHQRPLFAVDYFNGLMPRVVISHLISRHKDIVTILNIV